MSSSYITDSEGNVVYPKTLAKCVNKGGSTLEEYLNDVEDATLIKPTVSGTDIVLTDSSNMNIQELHLFGKTEQKTTNGVQLFNINDRLSETISTFSPIYNISEDGYITANIPLVDTEKYYNFFTKPSSLLKINKEYSAVIEIVDNPLNIRVTAISVQENVPGQFSNNVASTQVGTNITKVTTIDDFSKARTMCRGYIYVPANISGTVKFRVSIIEGTSVTANNFKYEPYTGGIASPSPEYPQDIDSVENPTVSVAGKNLYSFNMNGIPKETTRNGIKYIKNQDGSLKIKGTATAASKYEVISLNKSPQIFKNSTIGEKFTFKIFGLPETCYWEMAFVGKVYGEKSRTFVNIEKYASKKYTILAIPEGVTVDTTIYPMLVLGDSILEYEPYKEVQSAQQTCELNGIDDVKDELIVNADGTGKFVQRINKSSLNDKSNFAKWYETTNTYGFEVYDNNCAFYSSKINIIAEKLQGKTTDILNSGVYNANGITISPNGKIKIKILKKYLAEYSTDALKKFLKNNTIKILTILPEPTVTDLTAEEVQKILALHTNKPNTTIWNDQNADMQITYVADTKKYIDNKFTELENSVCGGLLITDNLIDNSNMLNNTALTISDKISTSSNSTYKTYLNIPVKAGESYYIGKSHRNSCIIDSIENKKVLQSNMVNQTDSYIFNVNYDGFLCVCFYTTEQNPKIALLTREKTES